MKFENKADFENQYNTMIDRAEECLNADDMEGYENALREAEELEASYSTYSTAMANINANREKTKGAMDIMKFNEGVMNNDIYSTMEYRNAFKDYVLKGAKMPNFMNSDATLATSDASVVIPSPVMQRIYDEIEKTGDILNRVTRTNYKGGLTIPYNDLKPTATWVAETSGSDTQTLELEGVVFAYHKLRCAVAVSLAVDTMAIDAFETYMVKAITEAMVKALENAIINGTGTGQPQGIKTATRSLVSQKVDTTDGITYAKLCEAEGLLPLGYESEAVWIMSKKIYMSLISMVDTDGQPIARVNYGIDGKPERYLLGREVVLCDYMPTEDSEGTTSIILFNLKDYVLNTNLNITFKKYEDNATDNIVTKAIMLADGKVIDTGSYVGMGKKLV